MTNVEEDHDHHVVDDDRVTPTETVFRVLQAQVKRGEKSCDGLTTTETECCKLRQKEEKSGDNPFL